jgi:hypothetical protein
MGYRNFRPLIDQGIIPLKGTLICLLALKLILT